jgi:hypothetical protein
LTQDGAQNAMTSAASEDNASAVSNAQSSAPTNASGDLTEAKRLIAQVNDKHDLQTTFGAMPKPDLKAFEFWNKVFKSVGDFFEKAGHLFKPLAPFMPYILGLIALAILAFLLSPVVRLMITSRFQRLFARDTLRADAPWRPTREAVVALLADIDKLAGEGSYDQAVHLLLVRSVADINAFRPDLVRKHYSARDIRSHPLLPEAARPAFTEIVRCVEKSFFAGIPATRIDFDTCRAAYTAFIAAEGIV